MLSSSHRFPYKTERSNLIKITCFYLIPILFIRTLSLTKVVVEPNGVEPLTSCVQGRRSTNWAMAPCKMVGLSGLEPLTPALSTRCSNQLSYRPNYACNKRKLKLKNNLLWILADRMSSIRRWSSRRFPYGYLVTTSPQSSTTPWWSPSLRLG